MAVATIPGLSTLGVLFGWGVEATAGTKPDAFTALQRCNAIDGISVENEQIDASALEDAMTKYVAGRGDPGGTWNVTFNYTDEVATALTAMIDAYYNASTGAKKDGKAMWCEVYHPNLTNGFFVKVEPPTKVPMPSMGQNELLTVEVGFTIVSYEGTATAIAPTI